MRVTCATAAQRALAAVRTGISASSVGADPSALERRRAGEDEHRAMTQLDDDSRQLARSLT